jgi:hypothetical protein
MTDKKYPLAPWKLRTLVRELEQDKAGMKVAFDNERQARMEAEARCEELTAKAVAQQEVLASTKEKLAKETAKNLALRERIGQMQEDVSRAVLCLGDMRGTGKRKRQLPALVTLAVKRLMPVLHGAPIEYTKEEEQTLEEMKD